jgi:hypothetical protein
MTAREIEALRLVAVGCSGAEIAAQMSAGALLASRHQLNSHPPLRRGTFERSKMVPTVTVNWPLQSPQ